ncbi:hypothetical protein D3Z33_09410 [Senegalia massiliensis]|uniref:Uncharacterized protein n=1 Tax=Senegalia massiliensis TaxID=1720316 RepID=A0A845QZ79_9CLOT|nr:hypothetical protein [Senegalia massiliensis]
MNIRDSNKVGDDMLAKISIAAYIISAVLHYTNDQMNLFWLSGVLGIVTFSISSYISFYRVIVFPEN